MFALKPLLIGLSKDPIAALQGRYISIHAF